MDKNGILAVFLLFLIVADVSDARFRDLAAAPTNVTATPVSNSNNKLNHKPIGPHKSNEVQQLSNSTQLDPKVLNDTNPKSTDLPTEGTNHGKNSSDMNLGSPTVETGTPGSNSSNNGVVSPVNNTDNGKTSKSSNSSDLTMSPPGNGTNPGDSNSGMNSMSNGDGTKEKNNGDKSSSESEVNETCLGLLNRCSLRTLIACIKDFDAASRKLSVLVQNEGEKTLRVNLTIPSAVENPIKQLKVSEHRTQMINILLVVGKSPKVILNAENRECLLHMAPLESEENAFLRFPYDKLATPINGVYILILSVVIFGGTWACCKFRKKKWHDGVPYQELEMGLPESVSAATVEPAEGWDQGWGDDWDDEDNSVKSPPVGNISANGLTSRSLNKDGWENDWDD